VVAALVNDPEVVFLDEPTTPLAPTTFLAAQVLSRLVVALTQTALILVVGVFVFHAHIYGNVLWLFLLAALANIVFFNIGIAVAGRAPNTDAATSIAQAVAMPMMFLSGVFFSTDSLPQVVRTVVAYLPLTPLNEALRKVALDGQSITAVGTQVLLLALWVAVSFALANRTFTFSRT
jgi:ABC-2 type transport system permease protein